MIRDAIRSACRVRRTLRSNHDGIGPSDVARGVLGAWRKGPAFVRMAAAMGLASERSRLTVSHALRRTARQYPHSPAIKSESGGFTWAQLDRRVDQIAGALSAHGLAPGDAVAVLFDNRPMALAVACAVVRAGGVASMLNTAQRPAALQHSLSCSSPVLAVVGEEHAATWVEAGLAIDGVTFWVRDDGQSPRPEAWPDLEEAAAQYGDPVECPSRFADPAFHIFTSGTTGLPKASIMSHKRWVGAGYMFGGTLLQLGPDDTLYAPLPVYHNQVLTLCWSACVRTGAALALRRRFSASAFWSDCRRHQATAFAYIGEVTRYLLSRAPERDERDHAVTRAVGVGLRAQDWAPLKTRFGIHHIYEYYSASELNAAFFNLFNLDQTVGFCFSPWALVQYDPETAQPARDALGRAVRVGPGEPGLLLTRVTRRFGFEGYTDARATDRKLVRDAFQEGDLWVNSGDLMRERGFGHLSFVDRIGDTFRWKSENVATTEVEGVLHTAPGVRDAAVYGVSVPGAPGRAGMAAVVPDGEQLDLDALLAHLRSALPDYAVPVFVRQATALETTATFKHVKTRLKRDGYDPAASADPVYVRLPGAAYGRLTSADYDSIVSGALSL